jgi:hypothetical protein
LQCVVCHDAPPGVVACGDMAGPIKIYELCLWRTRERLYTSNTSAARSA